MQVNSLYCPADNFKMQQVDEEKFSHLSHFGGTVARSETLARSTGIPSTNPKR